jgi:hypothetical protein
MAQMTLIGIWIDGDRGLAWSDSEVYNASGWPTGHRDKMAVNHNVGAVVVACGDTLLCDIGQEAVAATASFDQLIVSLPAQARRDWYPPKWGDRGGRLLAIGYSKASGRIEGYEYFAADDFLIRQVTSKALSPYVREIESSRDLRDVAKSQMAQVQKTIPDAGGGRVTLAEIERGGVIRLRTLIDFDIVAAVRRQIEVAKLECLTNFAGATA